MLHLSKQTTELVSGQSDQLNVYTNGKTEIWINGKVGKGCLAELYDVQGREALSSMLDEGTVN